ncbi:MAG TPA: peptidoglycan DD-metalloendopeptidase family protein [Longimicrobiaceae bacterium]|jgi:septal ring factor EnvC (AmiA/AmiB activator)|nr:peptidoglycan DD-metalloendopeptidase family protein [Longimicrobiaceae bacterium]
MVVRAAIVVAFGVVIPGVARAQQQPGRPATAQQEISESQRRLQEIREERAQLREELQQIRGQVHDASAEVAIIRRQVGASASVINELGIQLAAKQAQIDSTTRELIATQDRLAERRALLQRRLRDIYKRGPLQAVQVLLAAESFADFLNRYKYLTLVARHDHNLVREVDQLRYQLTLRDTELKRALSDIEYLRNEREQEHAQLQGLAQDHVGNLNDLRLTERSTVQHAQELAADERRLTSLISTLERRRVDGERAAAAARARVAASPTAPPAVRAAAAAPPPVASSLTPSDVGNLGWPVGGRVLYRFGRAPQTNGTVLRYNGVGIAAPAGTAVRAVESGTVVMAGAFEGYGPTVVVSHGGGYYSLYLYLRDVSVRQGVQVARGQVVGSVGGASTPQGSHIEFQIRSPGGQAVDPLTWLRSGGG